MVWAHGAKHPSQWAAIEAIASKLGCTSETLRRSRVVTETRWGARQSLHPFQTARLSNAAQARAGLAGLLKERGAGYDRLATRRCQTAATRSGDGGGGADSAGSVSHAATSGAKSASTASGADADSDRPRHSGRAARSPFSGPAGRASGLAQNTNR